MKTIIVTGTPGTGKTNLAKKLAKKLNYMHADVDKLISKYKLYEGYDRKRRTKIVDTNKLNRFLIRYIIFFKKNNISFDSFSNKKIIESALLTKARSTKTLKNLNIKKYLNTKIKLNKKYKGIIIDSHISHHLPRKYVDLCIVLKCGIKELNKRLKRKKFHKSKIQENLQAEIFDICHNEAMKMKHKILLIDATASSI